MFFKTLSSQGLVEVGHTGCDFIMRTEMNVCSDCAPEWLRGN